MGIHYKGSILIWIYQVKSNSSKAAMAEWLRRWTWNPMGSSRAGSNPARSAIIIAPFFLNKSLKKSKFCTLWTKEETFFQKNNFYHFRFTITQSLEFKLFMVNSNEKKKAQAQQKAFEPRNVLSSKTHLRSTDKELGLRVNDLQKAVKRKREIEEKRKREIEEKKKKSIAHWKETTESSWARLRMLKNSYNTISWCVILQFRVLVCSVLASKPSNIFSCFIDSLRKRMEFAKKDNRIDLKSHAFILTIRNILHTNEANTEHWRIRNWIIRNGDSSVNWDHKTLCNSIMHYNFHRLFVAW